MKKILLTATVQSHIAQFHRPLIKILKEAGYEIHVAARDNLDEKNGLSIKDADRIYSVPFARFPLHPRNIKAYLQLKPIIDQNGYDLISCNTPAGGVITRLAAIKARKHGSRVYYTAHGFHFYRGAGLKKWLLFYPIERFMARFTDVLITITKEDYSLAKASFKTDVRHIYGVGADEKKYSLLSPDVISFRNDLGLTDRFLILCTGELNDNKNQSNLIRAMKKVVDSHPEAKLILAGNGPKDGELSNLIKANHLEEYVELIGYRTDLEWYTNASDLIVSVSFREGLPLNIVEAMMCSKPVLVSHNRGHDELVEDGVTGHFVKADDPDDIARNIVWMIEHKIERDIFGTNGLKRSKKYQMKAVEKQLKKIYLT